MGPIFKLQESWDFLILEYGTNKLSRNIGKESSLYTAAYPRRTQISQLLSFNNPFNSCYRHNYNILIYVTRIDKVSESINHIIDLKKLAEFFKNFILLI